MQLFKTPSINFIGNRKKAFFLSGILIAGTLISILAHRGFNTSIDFIGGTVVELRFEKPVAARDLSRLRGIVGTLGFGQAEVKTVGFDNQEVQIAVKKRAEGSMVAGEITSAVKEKYPENPFTTRRNEQVGPKVGAELLRNAGFAILLSLFALVIYIAFRFSLPFGVAAVIALIHDVTVTVGMLSIVNAEMSLTIIAALLTIIGYSLNDTIVVFDRIRENLGGAVSKKSFEDKINTSINETLSRTVMTGMTTLFAVVTTYVIFFSSNEVIRDFSWAMLIGILIGTYSSIFVASPILVMWNKKWPIR